MSVARRPMRVLLVNHVGKMSGAESSLISMASALDKSSFELFAAVPEGDLAKKLSELGISVKLIHEWRPRRCLRPVRAFSMAFAWSIGVRRIANLIKSLDIDIVHSNSTPAHIIAAPAAFTCGSPSIWHVRDMIPLMGIGRLLSPLSTKVIAISDAVKKDLVLQGVEKNKIIRIYNGIDVESIGLAAQSPASKALPISAKARCVAMIAQLAPWKRHEDFIRAFGKIARHYPDLVCLVVGEDLFSENPAYTRHLRNVAGNTGFAERILFTGQRSDVPAIIARCEMVVLPSIKEPFGRVALEAMALGAPVIGADSGGLSELIIDGQSGLLVKPMDVEKLAAAIKKMLDDRELAARMGRVGRERATKIFSAKRQADYIANIYNELLSCKKKLRVGNQAEL